MTLSVLILVVVALLGVGGASGVLLLQRRKAALPPPAVLPPPLPEPEVTVARQSQEDAINDIVMRAAAYQWAKESAMKMNFDLKQRQTAAFQRALRWLHESKMNPPADLQARVRKALLATRGSSV